MKKLLVALTAVIISACASSHSPDVYEHGEANKLGNVTPAVILDVRQVTIKGGKLAGSTVGAALGGLGGYAAGGNDELRAATAVVGAIAGGVAGAFVEEKAMTESAYEYIVKKENGQIQTLVQTGDVPYTVGMNVYVVRSESGVRLIPAERSAQ